MFIGHYAVALASKKVTPQVSLGTLILSVQFLDLIWPIFLILGWEHVQIDPGNTAFTPLDLHDYPISHSLITAMGWSIAFGAIYYLVRRCVRDAWIVGAGVFSHWVLDFITHPPDLPIYPGSTHYLGLGLWNSVAGTLAVEVALFVFGIVLYTGSTFALDRTGCYAYWSWIAFLSVLYFASVFGPPPPSETVIAYGSLLIWLFVPWGYWIDRHRKPKTSNHNSGTDRLREAR